MSSSPLSTNAPSPWLRRLFEAPGLPVWLVGVAVALLGILGFCLQELLLGRFTIASRNPSVLGNLRVALIHIVITAYLLTAYVYAQITTEGSIRALLPVLDPRRVDELLAYSRRDRAALALSVPIGFLVFAFVSLQVSPGEVSLMPTMWDPEVAWHRILGLAMAVLALRLSVFFILESGRLSAIAGAFQHLDLLAPDSIAPFARQSLTYSLLVIGLVSVFALFLVDLRYLPLVGIVLAATLIVAGIALLMPLRGIRARIIQAKRVELEWCRAQMGNRRAEIARGAGADPVRLDELVAWEGRIQSVREWPLDASTFSRFVIYLLLPLGSWAGGALVERAVDALLD